MSEEDCRKALKQVAGNSEEIINVGKLEGGLSKLLRMDARKPAVDTVDAALGRFEAFVHGNLITPTRY